MLIKWRVDGETTRPPVDPADEEIPVAWTAIPMHEEVVDSRGEKVGTVEEVLGTGPTGIFHGLVVRTHLLQDPVEVPARIVESITNRRVTLSTDRAAFEGLPSYVEHDSFHLGIVGLFRHHLGWKEEK